MEILNYDTIQKHQSFNTIEEMDHAVRAFLYRFKSELSEGTLNVLKTIWRHSVKVVGASFAKYDYIAQIVNISRRTVIRAVNKLEELGILKRVPTVRANKKRGVNIIVIQKVDGLSLPEEKEMSLQDVTPPVTTNKTEDKHSSLCENKKNRNNVSEPTINELDASFTPGNVNSDFVEAARPFFNNAKAIFGLWGRILIAYRKIKLNNPIEQYIDIVVDSFRNTVFQFKQGKIGTFEGYFYSVVYQNFLHEKRMEYQTEMYDWIND